MTLFERITSSVAYSARKHGEDPHEVVERWLNEMSHREFLQTISDGLEEQDNELLQMLDDVSAVAETLLGCTDTIPETARMMKVRKARELCDELLRPNIEEET